MSTLKKQMSDRRAQFLAQAICQWLIRVDGSFAAMMQKLYKPVVGDVGVERARLALVAVAEQGFVDLANEILHGMEEDGLL